MANYFEDNAFFSKPFFKTDYFQKNPFFQLPFFGTAFNPPAQPTTQPPAQPNKTRKAPTKSK